MSDRHHVDLSTGTYDDLEVALSGYLGIKVMLVRRWQPTSDYYMKGGEARSGRLSASEFAQVQRELIGGLRGHLVNRDPDVGATIRDAEILSLAEVGHVTLRESACTPARAVLLRDPTPHILGEGAGLLGWLIGVGRFRNAWVPYGADGSELDLAPLASSAEISPADARAYQAFLDIRHALTNQFEYDGLDGRDQPFYVSLFGLAVERRLGIHPSFHDLGFDQAARHLEIETSLTINSAALGITDREFMQKLLEARAVGHLFFQSLDPVETFARLMREHPSRMRGMVRGEMHHIQQRLSASLDEAVRLHLMAAKDPLRDADALDDIRVLAPLFREARMRRQNLSEAEALYLDTIAAGLRRFFPTLSDTMVPALDRSTEPPRCVRRK